MAAVVLQQVRMAAVRELVEQRACMAAVVLQRVRMAAAQELVALMAAALVLVLAAVQVVLAVPGPLALVVEPGLA
jgi:hypothetical protein